MYSKHKLAQDCTVFEYVNKKKRCQHHENQCRTHEYSQSSNNRSNNLIQCYSWRGSER